MLISQEAITVLPTIHQNKTKMPGKEVAIYINYIQAI